MLISIQNVMTKMLSKKGFVLNHTHIKLLAALDPEQDNSLYYRDTDGLALTITQIGESKYTEQQLMDLINVFKTDRLDKETQMLIDHRDTILLYMVQNYKPKKPTADREHQDSAAYAYLRELANREAEFLIPKERDVLSTARERHPELFADIEKELNDALGSDLRALNHQVTLVDSQERLVLLKGRLDKIISKYGVLVVGGALNIDGQDDRWLVEAKLNTHFSELGLLAMKRNSLTSNLDK